MVTAAKTVGQVGMHMTVAFNVMYISTGSVALGGIAAVFEPVRNMMLLPLKVWEKIRRKASVRERLRMQIAPKNA